MDGSESHSVFYASACLLKGFSTLFLLLSLIFTVFCRDSVCLRFPFQLSILFHAALPYAVRSGCMMLVKHLYFYWTTHTKNAHK